MTVHILLCLCTNPPHLFPLLNVLSNVSPRTIIFPHRCLLKHGTNERLPARGKIAKWYLSVFSLSPPAFVNYIKVYLKHKLSKMTIERFYRQKKRKQWLYFNLVSIFRHLMLNVIRCTQTPDTEVKQMSNMQISNPNEINCESKWSSCRALNSIRLQTMRSSMGKLRVCSQRVASCLKSFRWETLSSIHKWRHSTVRQKQMSTCTS